MSWDYSFSEKALKQLRKLGHDPARKIVAFLREKVAGDEDPRRFGKQLKGELGEFWRYRVDDFRIICHIEDGQMRVMVVKVGHRKNVY
ncbi:type II toxin-antitoxin system RelE/ParE family toxin [Akkermansiaceae bacterium]|nr:type II toxin-antitoxin system RelE/ParE family toxin [Akkermansiaceae bacterium]